jgi:hypothetical protein
MAQLSMVVPFRYFSTLRRSVPRWAFPLYVGAIEMSPY